MRKHLVHLLIAYTCFEIFRRLGAELPDLFRGNEIFAWLRNSNFVIIIIANFIIFLSYPLVSFIIFQKFFHNNKHKTIIYLLIGAFIIITFRYLIEEKLFLHIFGFHNYYKDVPLLYFYVDNIYYAVVYSGFGIVYFFLVSEQRRKLEHNQLLLENKQAQLSFLQSQINPHFLFNNLNNIYALVYQQSSRSLEAISKLSDILRYMLYENNERVTLAKEINYIEKYIDLQQLRFDKPLSIQMESEGKINTVYIPPLLLIPFVENAFKHGDFKHFDIHLFIMIKVKENTIDFFIRNKKRDGEKDVTGGIGLQNIRKRLELLYPGRHSFTIEDSHDIYTVKLKLTN